MRITPISFVNRAARVISIDDDLKQIYLEFAIVHGAPAGMTVVMSRPGTSL
jgi:hypothetical protein